MYNIKVKHLYHSGFSIESEDKLIIIDYYKGDLEKSLKDTLILVSHSHQDHLNLDILNLKDININYIFSSDIKDTYKSEDIIYMDPYEKTRVKDVEIQSFSSTDAGISFLIKLKDLSIFHSGDLNWWYWENDDEAEKARMEKAFKDEIDKISKHKINLAFFPVDPRLGEGYSFGGRYFIEKVRPKIFFPMHFGDEYGITRVFKDSFKFKDTKVMEINHKGQVFEL